MTNKKPIQNTHSSFYKVLGQSTVLKLSLGALVITGMIFLSSTLLRLFESISLVLVYLHCLFGVVLCVAVTRFIMRGPRFFLNELLSMSRSRNSSKNIEILSGLLILCLAILALSGTGLLFSRITLHGLGMAFVYVHAMSFFFLVIVLALMGFIMASGKKSISLEPDTSGEWPCRIIPGSFDLMLTSSPVSDTAEGFLQIFAMVLKHSKLRLFLDGYSGTVEYTDIFNRDMSADKPLDNDEPSRLRASDYIISIYKKYFTFRGWVQRTLLSSSVLTDRHISDMAEVFYGYVPCSRCGDSDELVSQQGLMAKLGRFFLAEMGIRPGAFKSALPGISSVQIDISDTSTSTLIRSIRTVEAELETQTGMKVILPLDKHTSDVVFFPAIHDFSLQSDTLRGLAVALHCMKSNWTLGNNFFDGFNYGGFFGDWFVGRVMEGLASKATELGASTIVLGGCQGISIPGSDIRVVGANDLVLQAITNGAIQFQSSPRYVRIGYSGFCDEGCHLNKGASSIKILKSLGCSLVEIGRPGSHTMHTDRELLEAVTKEKPDIIVAPFHNSRERLKFLLKINKVPVEVCGLFDLLVTLIKPLDEMKKS